MTAETDLAIPKHMAFDEECLKLARYFCPHAPALLLYQLAWDIQQLVESSDASRAELLVTCPACNGEPFDPEVDGTCRYCDGAGKVTRAAAADHQVVPPQETL